MYCSQFLIEPFSLYMSTYILPLLHRSHCTYMNIYILISLTHCTVFIVYEYIYTALIVLRSLNCSHCTVLIVPFLYMDIAAWCRGMLSHLVVGVLVVRVITAKAFVKSLIAFLSYTISTFNAFNL